MGVVMGCCGNRQDFCVGAGATFHPVIRWGTDVLVSVPITGISQTAPTVVTAAGHGAPDGWEAAVVSAKGLYQINATRYPPQGPDWRALSVIDMDTVSLVNTNTADATPYLAGGFLVYSTPGLLAGMTGSMTFYDNPSKTGVPLLALTSGNGLVLDLGDKTINPLIDTSLVLWTTAYYWLDVTDADGVVTEVLEGTLTIQ